MNQKKSLLIASLLLMLTILAPLIALPNVNASTPPKTWPTVAYLSVAPNPIGIGQQALFIMWLDKANPLLKASMDNDSAAIHSISLTQTDKQQF